MDENATVNVEDKWRRIINLQSHTVETAQGATEEVGARGLVEMAKGFEQRPCYTCSSWEKDQARLARHLHAHGCPITAEGFVTTPIIRDLPGRQVLTLRIQELGWCRLEGLPSQDEATCENHRGIRTREQLAQRLSLLGRRS